MEGHNLQSATSKPLTHQKVYCPWTSKAPFTSTISVKNGQSGMDLQNGILSTCLNSTQHLVKSNCQQATGKYNSAPKKETPIQQSSSQFFHFLRLMQLFPDVHPATLHTVMTLCQNNFFAAVDKLLYAKKCKEVYTNRKPFYQQCQTGSRLSRFQPYCCSFGRTNNGVPPLHNTTSCNFNQTTMVASTNGNAASQGQNHSATEPVKMLDAKKVIIRSRLRKEKVQCSPKTEKPPSTPKQEELQPVASPRCKLPIHPLSPLTLSPEDLSCPNENLSATPVLSS